MWIDIDDTKGARHHNIRFEQIALVTQWSRVTYITLSRAGLRRVELSYCAPALRGGEGVYARRTADRDLP